jgi:hypothetical protein
MLTENTKAIIVWLNVCVIWGTTYLVIRIGVGQLPPMLFAGIRWVIAGVIFITVLKWRGKVLPKANEIVHLRMTVESRFLSGKKWPQAVKNKLKFLDSNGPRIGNSYSCKTLTQNMLQDTGVVQR